MNTNDDTKNTFTRRSFIRKSALAVSAFPILASVTLAPAVAQAPAAPTTPVDENSPVAKALSYVADATKSTNPMRTAATAATHFCKNCVLYKPAETKVAGKDGQAWGVCTVVSQGLVNANGWCVSWAQKPGAA